MVHPGGFIGKAIHLDRNTVRRGLHHAHHLNHVLMNFRVTLDISHAVSAEGAQVGQATVIDRIQTGTAQLLVGALQIFFFLVQVIAQQGKARQAIDFCWSQKSNAGGIDAQGALDTTAARFKHLTPVAIALGKQLVSGNGGNRLVPVLDLDRVQRHINNKTIRPGLLHFDPVADAQHVIGAHLRAGHQRQQSVFKDQQEHRRQCTQTGEQQNGRLIQNDGDHDNNANRPHCYLSHFHIALDGLGTPLAGIGVDLLPGPQQADNRHDEKDQKAQQGYPLYDFQQSLGQGQQGQIGADHQQGHGIAHIAHKALLDQGTRPIVLARHFQQAPHQT